VRAADTMVQSNVQPNVARRVLQMAHDMDIERRSSTWSTPTASRTYPASASSSARWPRS
jgi:hypothetical protein